MTAAWHYRLFGWRVRTAFPVPELLAWRGDDRAPDVVIETATVPERLEDARQFGPATQIGADGRVLFRMPAVAGYLIEGGSRVTVEAFMPIDAPDVRVFLLGTVLAILCFRRGLLPLHASAVEVPGGALLFCGDSGIGKSTLAASLAARGHRLVSDDLCALEFTAGSSPLIHPAFPRLKLWADAAERLEVSTDGLERSRGQLEKFHVPVAEAGFRAQAIAPAHLVVLRHTDLQGPVQLRPLRGLDAMLRKDVIHRWRLGEALGYGPVMFDTLARLFARVPITELTRTADLASLPLLADQVLALPRAA